MTTYIIINSIAILGLSLTCFYLLYKQRKLGQATKPTETNDYLSEITGLDWISKALLVLAFIIILISFISPFFFTRVAVNEDFDYTKTGQIGDTIGGLMNPFIALAGVIVTGLAFYMQYNANRLQRNLFQYEQTQNKDQFQQQIDFQNKQIQLQQKQLQLQQFESQFYEMLKLHRENISEMKINGYDFEEISGQLNRFEKITDGRKIFVVMQTEFECILRFYAKDKKLDKDGFRKCYQLFFSGLDKYEKAYPDEKIFVGNLKYARRIHENPSKSSIYNNKDRKEFLNYVKLDFNYKPFSGHEQRLGHYFRHLYLTVKSIVNSSIVVDYEERMRYLRILRAQLSNNEQILLFYNWLSDYGKEWENDEHPFFTEYCMIHNLWYGNLFEDDFISNSVDELRNKKVELRKGLMFEIDE